MLQIHMYLRTCTAQPYVATHLHTPTCLCMQGFPMYCDSAALQGSLCHVNGGLCKKPEAQSPGFRQDAYEKCMREQGTQQCLVSDSVIDKFRSRWEQISPEYLTDNYTFLDHETFKHGSCRWQLV